MQMVDKLLANAALRVLWRAPAFRGRWRLQRWAEQRPALYAGHPARHIALGGFGFAVEPGASHDVFLNGITPSSAIERIIRAHVKPGDSVIDVGANIGWTARLMSALVGAAGQVHAFEPIPRAYQNLCLNARSAPTGNIHTYRTAASDQAGEIELFLAADDAAALASMRRPEGGGAVRAERVPMVTLDSLQDKLGRVAFVKIDVEGAEHKVLLGMDAILRRWQPTVALELSDAWLRKLGSSGQALIDHMVARGYAVLVYDDGNYAPLATAPAHQVDVVCVPAAGGPRR